MTGEPWGQPLRSDPEDRSQPDPPSSDDLVGGLTRWLADARSDAAVASRARERWLRQQAEEEALFAGILLDLAERNHTVVIQLAGRRRHHGHVRAVADDFLALRSLDGTDLLLRYDGIVAVRPQGSAAPFAGDRPCALDMTFAEAIAALAAERPRVLVMTRDGTGLSGDLRAAGRDVFALRFDGDARATGYVPLAAVAEITITR